MNLHTTSITTEYKISLPELKAFIATQLNIGLDTHDIRITETRKYDDHAYGIDRGVFDGLEVTVTNKEKP